MHVQFCEWPAAIFSQTRPHILLLLSKALRAQYHGIREAGDLISE
jgi:hypothetical protein